MIIGFIIFAVLGVAVGSYFAVKKDIGGILLPLCLFLLLDVVQLYTKYVAPSNIFVLLLFVPSAALLLVALTIMLVKVLRKNPERRIVGRKRAILFIHCALAIAIFLLPAFDISDRYSIHEDDYIMVADALFEAYDRGEFTDGYSFDIDLGRDQEIQTLAEKTSPDIARRLQNLSRQTNAFRLLIDKDAVYFHQNGFLQSVTGIAIFRETPEGDPDPTFLTRYLQNPYFSQIKDKVYLYEGGQ